jgi:hypothetical protein
VSNWAAYLAAFKDVSEKSTGTITVFIKCSVCLIAYKITLFMPDFSL